MPGEHANKASTSLSSSALRIPSRRRTESKYARPCDLLVVLTSLGLPWGLWWLPKATGFCDGDWQIEDSLSVFSLSLFNFSSYFSFKFTSYKDLCSHFLVFKIFISLLSAVVPSSPKSLCFYIPVYIYLYLRGSFVRTMWSADPSIRFIRDSCGTVPLFGQAADGGEASVGEAIKSAAGPEKWAAPVTPHQEFSHGPGPPSVPSHSAAVCPSLWTGDKMVAGLMNPFVEWRQGSQAWPPLLDWCW